MAGYSSMQQSKTPKSQRDLLSNRFSVAMVEPTFPLNVGYVARAMGNFSLKNLIIVSPRKSIKFDTREALRFASHANQIIEKAEWTDSFAILRKQFQLLIGTTAIQGRRKSNITRNTMTPEEFSERLSELPTPRGQNRFACIVLGRDTTGLTNEELKKCDYNVTIRTGSDYNTLNVSHAAAILFYEISRHFGGGRRSIAPINTTRPQPARPERELVVRLFQQLAIESEFQKFKRDRLEETLNRLLNRSNPTKRELYLLMGLASKANSKIRRASTIRYT